MMNKYNRSLVPLVIFILMTVYSVTAQEVDMWEADMLAFEALDRTNTYPPESILFTGSSSIRLWTTLERDMAPYPVIQRGFGGSKMTDVLKHADRFIGVHTFSAVVVFVANDIHGNPDEDRTPDEVRNLFNDFISKIRGYNPEAPIFIIAITPTNSRWAVWPQSRQANHLLAILADDHKNVIFIPTEDVFLGEDGRPIDDLFVSDQLHLSEAGYGLWTKRLRSYLDPVLE